MRKNQQRSGSRGSTSFRNRRVFTKLVKDDNAVMDNLSQARRFLEGMDSFESKADLLAQLEDDRHCGLRRIRELLSFVESLQHVEELLIGLLKQIMTNETERPMFKGLRNKVLLAVFSVPALMETLVQRQIVQQVEMESAEFLCSFLLAISSTFVEARHSESVIALAKYLRSRGDVADSLKLCNCLLVDSIETEEDVLDDRKRKSHESVVGWVSRKLFKNPVACWVTDRIPPGGRHDNDHQNYRDIEVVPSVEELKSDSQSWLPLASGENAIIQDAAMYHIDKSFRLLREDAVRTMKNNIREARKVWKNARVIDLEKEGRLNRGKIAFLVQCDMRRSSKGNWERSRDLMHGSVIAFCRSGVPIMMGVIVIREFETPNKWLNADGGPILGVEFHSDSDFEKALRDMQINCSFNTRIAQLRADGASGGLIASHKNQFEAYDMIEASSSFFSYQPILKTLQTITDLPFRPELCGDEHTEGQARLDYIPDVVTMPSDQDFGSYQCNLRAWCTEAVVQETSLDTSQAEAIHHVFTNRVSLIQGPPGTGKTFIGGLLARMIRLNTDESILCVCYTNHALDQFLEYMLDAGEDRLVRIGGRSKSEKLQRFQLRDLARHKSSKGVACGRRIKQVDAQRFTLRDVIAKQIQTIKLPIDWKTPNGGVSQFLQDEEVEYYQYLSLQAYVGNDGFTIVGADGKALREDTLWQQWSKGEEFPRWLRPYLPDLSNEHNFQVFWSLPYEERIALISKWKDDVVSEEVMVLRENVKRYKQLCEERRITQQEQDLGILEEARVIGATTTGACQYKDILSRKNAGVIVVEEAGEVLEAHVLSTLQLGTKHLVLIGDHKQLRPKVEDYALTTVSGSGFDLDCSLFERLVLAELPSVSLEVQHRMRPEISAFVREQTYPALQDHPSVTSFPNVRGVSHNVVFIDHSVLENGQGRQDEDSAGQKTKSNSHEAEFCVEMVRFFLLQGYAPSRVVLLTPYLGQVKRLLQSVRSNLKDVSAAVSEKDQRDLELLEDSGDQVEASELATMREVNRQVRVSSIDNFQGEEADIVVVSLVRSNPRGNIGFLAEEQRVNVLMSRARIGLYLVGNAATLRLSSKGRTVWLPILDTLRGRRQLLKGLPTTCQLHPDDPPIALTNKQDFRQHRPNGGCSRPCNFRMTCGHVCRMACHPFDREHTKAQKACLEPCMRVPVDCPMNHPCPKYCKDDCGPCSYDVGPIRLNCGHVKLSVRCHDARDDDSILKLSQKCKSPVRNIFDPCGHSEMTTCGNARQDNPVCPAQCGALSPNCNHPCSKSCFSCNGEHKCGERCQRIIFCGHICERPCHIGSDCPPCSKPCTVVCSHSRCPKKCHSPCSPCVEKCDWECQHQGPCPLVCGAPCSRLPCNKRCDKMLKCGHRCPSLCGEPCPPAKFCKICADAEVKGQVVDMIALATYEEHDVDEEPVLILPCEHIYTVSTLDGLLGLGQVYHVDPKSGDFLGVKPLAGANVNERPTSCPDCRSPIHSIRRYGRLLRLSELRSLERKRMMGIDRTFQLLKERSAGTGPRQLNGPKLVESLKKLKDDILQSPMRKVMVACRNNDALSEVAPPPSRPLLQALGMLGNVYANMSEVKNDDNYVLAYGSFEEGIKLADETTSTMQGGRMRLALCSLLLRWSPVTRSTQQAAKALLCWIQLPQRSVVLTAAMREEARQLQHKLNNPHEEIQQVMQAVGDWGDGFHHGGSWSSHWYECPNGHPYFIGECGGAMESSHCIECGEIVGGTRHTLNASNRQASNSIVGQLLTTRR